MVRGGRPLYGTAQVPAAKNSVLPLLAASLLCGGPVRLRGVPRLSDVEGCMALLRGVGCAAAWDGGDVVVEGRAACCRLPAAETARMRASVLFAAPLLGRLGRAETALPGGCNIGARPVDWHLGALERMGARVEQAGDRLILTAPAGLRGACIRLPGPSVGATETVLLAGCAAHGPTRLQGAAREPEIVDLARFLNACGGCVRGAGSAEIVIEGGRPLRGAAFAPMPDRICASTLACAAALKTIEIMERDHLAERSCQIGETAMKRYNEWKEKYEVVGDVRGLGGMVGIEFVKSKETKEPAPEFTAALVHDCAMHGLIVESAGTYGNVIRFLAPLVITDEQLETGLAIMEQAIVRCMSGQTK